MHANDDERTAGMTKPAAKYVVIEFIEADYNRRRPHSTIGYQMPARAMESFFERAKPAEGGFPWPRNGGVGMMNWTPG